MKILIVDYGMGNILSVQGALNYLGYEDVLVSCDPQQLAVADKLILPGVGHFYEAMQEIKKRELIPVLTDLVMERKTPILGICLGMQLLGKSSTEGQFTQGLGFVDGEVKRFQVESVSVPHVGANQISPFRGSRLFRGLGDSPDFYFTHSFRMKSSANIGASSCEYEEEFVASFEFENIAGAQFHPELSQKNGLTLLNNFLGLF